LSSVPVVSGPATDNDMKRWLKQAWSGWKQVAGFIGRIQTRILLTVCYVLVVGPTSAFIRLKDRVQKNSGRSNTSYWVDYDGVADEFERARRQF
jgi:hypothetical protein